MDKPHYRIAVLPGDGVGPEVTRVARDVAGRAAELAGLDLEFIERSVGGAAFEATGTALPDETLELCRGVDAILFGATGAPQWDHLTGHQRPGSSLLRLRRELGLSVNLRPVRFRRSLAAASPLRADITEGTDFIVVRELAGGIYFGDSGREGSGPAERAFDTMAYSREEISRVAEYALGLAARRAGRLTSVDKANVLRSGRLWRDVVTELGSAHPGITLNHQLVDSFCFRVLLQPSAYDVVVTENLLGDIISDEAAVICGSLGLMPSASLNPAGGPALYEPVHGSAPDIAGTDSANPMGAVLSAALMFEHSLNSPQAAQWINDAVDQVIDAGTRTPDLGGTARCSEVGEALIAALPQGALVGADR